VLNSKPNSSSSLGRNQVLLTGKLSRVGPVKYTPSGIPIQEIVVAVQQTHLEKANMGYFEVLLSGALAEQVGSKLKIGKEVEVSGALWSREYRNRQGVQLKETKILANQIGETHGRENKTI